MALGNGTATSYSYNPLNRRMTNLLAQTKSARTFMNMAYGYDAVGNIKTLANSAAIPASTALYGGTTSYSFGYDDLYQLTSATGAFAKPNVPTQEFTLAMAYDGIHNITRKTQTAFNLWSTGAKTPNTSLSYDYAYAYAGGRPHAASQVGIHTFNYDLDGNQAGWRATNSGQNRVMVWDEDNRLQSVTDSSQQPTTFKYDDGTNRVVKKGSGGETLYINPWYVASLGRNSKQIFAGATRIVTKLEQFPSGEGYGTGAKNLTSFYQYFYHPDHLGSTGFVTDATGEVYQHLEYFPFGETWVDEVSDDTRVPYRFTGQEFDAETRLYYYGARYFDPRTSAWQNPDPALGKNFNRQSAGNRFDPRNLNTFGYAYQNPLVLVDPDGREPWSNCGFSNSMGCTFKYTAVGFVTGAGVGVGCTLTTAGICAAGPAEAAVGIGTLSGFTADTLTDAVVNAHNLLEFVDKQPCNERKLAGAGQTSGWKAWGQTRERCGVRRGGGRK